MNNVNPVFVKLTKRGADFRMTNGKVGALYEVVYVTRGVLDNTFNVTVITGRKRSPSGCVIEHRCTLGPRGDYELVRAGDRNQLLQMALHYEEQFLQNNYNDELWNMMQEDDRNPVEFEDSREI